MLFSKPHKIDAVTPSALDGFSVITQTYVEVVSTEKSPAIMTQTYADVIASEKLAGIITQAYAEVITTI